MLVSLPKTNAVAKIVPELRREAKDWKVLQQQNCWFEDIKADAVVKRFVDTHPVKFDTEFAAPDLKDYVFKNASQGSDFFIITDREFSKNSLASITDSIHHKMSQASFGGYVSLLSYYLNWQNEEVDKNYPDVFSAAIGKWIEKLSYRTQNVSAVIDYPILKYERANYHPDSHGLFEGKNFLFSHPNIRFWIWK
jgi:hypothetical protein